MLNKATKMDTRVMCQLKEHQKLNDLLCAACGVDLKWDGKPDVTQRFNA